MLLLKWNGMFSSMLLIVMFMISVGMKLLMNSV